MAEFEGHKQVAAKQRSTGGARLNGKRISRIVATRVPYSGLPWIFFDLTGKQNRCTTILSYNNFVVRPRVERGRLMMMSKVGPPVTGKDFFDRENEQGQMWEYLDGDDLLLLAPRRVGKTSLMFRLRATAADKGFEAAYVSVAGVHDEIGFVSKLCEAVSGLGSAPGILKRFGKGRLGRLLKRIKKVNLSQLGFELADGDDWKEIGAELAQALESKDGRTLLLVDEVPVFVLSLLAKEQSGDRARRFLSWFRELRQQPDRQGRLRWFLAGSIGLDTVTARLGLGDTINHLYTASLGPFQRQTAKSFLQELSSSYGFLFPENVLDHALDRIGWLIPYYLQLIFRELRAYCGEGVTPDMAAIDRVFDDLLAPSKKAYFDYWRQRLAEELGQPDANWALLILSAAAADAGGVGHSNLGMLMTQRIQDQQERTDRLRYLLDVLITDGYLVQDEHRYRFRSPLLREFWLRRVV